MRKAVKCIQLGVAASLLLLLGACDQSGALNEMKRKAEGGDASAQSILASWYYEGNERLGILQDYDQGLEWFRRAAEQGEPYALRMLANSYYFGTGVPRDYAQAAHWYLKAAEQGDPYGQYWIGGAYAEGPEGIFQGLNEPQDLVLGYAWSNLASNGNDGDAAKRRNKVEALLTPAQLAEAQRLSSGWRKGQPIRREQPATP